MAWKFDQRKLPKPAKLDGDIIVGNLKNGNPQLSPNFKANEFTCPDCKDYKVSVAVLEGLELAREKCKKPLHVADTTLESPNNPLGSGYRCRAHNAKVAGAVQDSVHIAGRAADVSCPDIPVSQLYTILESIPTFKNGGMGKYRTFVHVDTGRRRRWIG